MISLRKFGYRLNNADTFRYNALDKAVQASGYDAVIERLEFVKEVNSKFAPQIDKDIKYIIVHYCKNKNICDDDITDSDDEYITDSDSDSDSDSDDENDKDYNVAEDDEPNSDEDDADYDKYVKHTVKSVKTKKTVHVVPNPVKIEKAVPVVPNPVKIEKTVPVVSPLSIYLKFQSMAMIANISKAIHEDAVSNNIENINYHTDILCDMIKIMNKL